MYYSAGTYESFAHPEKPKDVDKKSAYIIGTGLAGLTAAFYLVRDGQMKGEHIHLFEKLELAGGSCDGRKDVTKGFFMRGGREMDNHFEVMWDTFRDVPSIETPGISVLDEYYWLNKHDPNYSLCRATVNRGEDAHTDKKFALDKASALALSKLFLTPEKDLEDKKISDILPESFWSTNFWLYWQTMFAFQRWSSALEMKRYLCRYVHHIDGLPDFSALRFTKYNQYESMILPLVKYLESHGVRIEYGMDVKNVIIETEGDRRIAKQIVYVKDGTEQTIDLVEDDLVFITNGCCTDTSCYGDQTHAPDLTGIRNGFGESWDMWKAIAAQAKNGEYGNPDVAWEEATKADVGIELGLFNKIKIQADYFYEKREGIFIQRESTPSVVGTKTAQWVNLGRMKNQGFDMSLEFDHSFNKDFSISARGNFTYNRNKKLYDDKPDQIWKYQNLAGFANNQQFGLIAEGLFESEEDIANWPKQDFGTVRPGDIKYRDVNGDGVVNTFDKVAIGYTLVPEINYGFGASLKWKGIDVSVFFSGVGHVTRIIQGQNLFGASSTILRMGQIFEDVAKNRWTLDNQNPNAPYPRLSLNKVDNNQQLSTYWQRDMSFLRLKDAEIGYTLPESMTKKWGLSKIRFYIQGKNLITFSDFKLWDPEVNANYGNVYPLIRTFAIGANVNF